MSEIIGIGASVYDTLMLSPLFPEEDTKIQAVQTMTQGGGPCATALVAASRLGATASYMGNLGSDSYGQFMKKDFEKYGVDVSLIKDCPDCISFHSFVLLNTKKSTRTIIWNKGTVPLLTAPDVDCEEITKAKVLHLDGNQMDAAVYAARFAHRNGIRVSLDAGAVYPGIEQLLPFADILIPSEEFAIKSTGQRDVRNAAQELMRKYHPEVLVITRGSKGGILCDGDEFREYPCYPVDVIDSCGAGDVFHGAFLAALLRGGRSVYECCCFASAVSAVKCTHFGARDGIPTYEHTLSFLRDREGKPEDDKCWKN